MKQTRNYFQELVRLVLPVVILTVGVVGFGALASQRETPESRKNEKSLPLVQTEPVRSTSDELQIELDGMVVPFREIQLSAEVGGKITKKFSICQAGRYVTKGTPLLQIDRRTYQLVVERLKQELSQAENSLKELTVQISTFENSIQLLQEDLKLKREELNRAQRVFERGGLNESELNDFQANELNARNTLVSMQNEKRIAEASRERLTKARDLAQTRLEEAKLELEKTEIVAPIDGVIVTESAEEGNYVAAGTALVTIDDTSTAEVGTTLRMEELEWIWRHQHSLGKTEAESPRGNDYQLPQVPATISYQLGAQTYQWRGYLSRYEGIGLNEQTRTVPVRILVPEPRQVTIQNERARAFPGGPKALVRGMFVDIALSVRPNASFLTVPEEAVQPGNRVWVVRDGKLEQITFDRTNYQNGRLLVAAGESDLQPNDLVVVSPLLTAQEGQQVQPTDTAQIADSGKRATERPRQ